jgi:hypothetical protein
VPIQKKVQDPTEVMLMIDRQDGAQVANLAITVEQVLRVNLDLQVAENLVTSMAEILTDMPQGMMKDPALIATQNLDLETLSLAMMALAATANLTPAAAVMNQVTIKATKEKITIAIANRAAAVTAGGVKALAATANPTAAAAVMNQVTRKATKEKITIAIANRAAAVTAGGVKASAANANPTAVAAVMNQVTIKATKEKITIAIANHAAAVTTDGVKASATNANPTAVAAAKTPILITDMREQMLGLHQVIAENLMEPRVQTDLLTINQNGIVKKRDNNFMGITNLKKTMTSMLHLTMMALD